MLAHDTSLLIETTSKSASAGGHRDRRDALACPGLDEIVRDTTLAYIVIVSIR